MTATGTARFQELLSTRAARGGRPPQHVGGPRFQFGSGKPDPGSFPYQDLAQAMADVMEMEGADALTYGSLYGYDALRDWVCHKYDVFEGLKLSRDNILITNGSGDAIGHVIQTFVDDGDVVVTEAPTFLATLGSLRRNGADLIGIEVDDEGMRTDILADRLAQLEREGRRCKLIYTIDTFQNPSGPTLSEPRRRHLLELARHYNIAVMEDDAYGELRFEGTQPPSLYSLDQDDLVVRTGTLSKILGAGVRLGWCVAPAAMVPYLAAFNYGGGVSPLTSRICTYYMRENLEGHVAHLRNVYRDKRDAMIGELERGLSGTDATWSRPQGGFFIWLKLPTGTSQTRLAELAKQEDVGYVVGPAFMPNGGGEEYIRLAFSFEAPDEIREGTRRLCRAILGARADG
ncbi:MAG: PLP-dependent aminotransferase family protein [Chloroflexi bacterium]|nr:PLP-dependent aminotransferase family protein [Chloroflexota bacterium]